MEKLIFFYEEIFTSHISHDRHDIVHHYILCIKRA